MDSMSAQVDKTYHQQGLDVQDWTHLIEGSYPTLVLDNLNSTIAREKPYLTGERTLQSWNSLAGIIGGASAWLAGVGVLHGAAACQDAIAVFAPHIGRAIREAESEFAAIPQEWGLVKYSLLTSINLVKCCGGKVPAEAEGLEGRWLVRQLQQRRNMSHRDRLEAALAAVGSRETQLVPSFLGGGALPSRLRQRQSFGRNVTKFVRYLAVVVASGADVEAIEPAWLEFVDEYPYLYSIQDGPVHWYHLVWSGYIVLSLIGSHPAERVMDDLHALVLDRAKEQRPP
jgi:hypothetical protein